MKYWYPFLSLEARESDNWTSHFFACYTDVGGCGNRRGYCSYRVVQFRGVLWLRPLSEDLFSARVMFLSCNSEMVK